MVSVTNLDKKIDTDQLREEAAALAKNIVDRAECAADWVAPRVVRARGEALRIAKEAQSRAQPVVNTARSRVVDDYVPAAQRAAQAAQVAAATEGSLTERAQRIAVAAKSAALETPEVSVKKKHTVLKTIGWLALAGAAAGAAYVVWRRSQPVEDPWAEEYWADVAEDEDAPAPAEAPAE